MNINSLPHQLHWSRIAVYKDQETIEGHQLTTLCSGEDYAKTRVVSVESYKLKALNCESVTHNH